MKMFKRNLFAVSLSCLGFSAAAATITVDAYSGSFNKVERVIAMATIDSGSPIANELVINNGDIKVAAVYLVKTTGGEVTGLWQAMNGRTKTHSALKNSGSVICGGTDYRGGIRFADEGKAMFSDDGAILAAEVELKVRGSSVYHPFVGVWKVLPNGNKGGDFKAPVILCDADGLKSVKGATQSNEYVIVGENENLAMDKVYTVKR